MVLCIFIALIQFNFPSLFLLLHQGTEDLCNLQMAPLCHFMVSKINTGMSLDSQMACFWFGSEDPHAAKKEAPDGLKRC